MYIPVKADIHVATYISNKSIQEMLYCISEVIEGNILNKVHESDHFLSCLMKQPIVLLLSSWQYMVGTLVRTQGSLKHTYLTTVDVLEPEIEALRSGGDLESCISVGASTITKRIMEFIENNNLDMAKLRGIGTDGAATMTGCRTGVVTRQKQIALSAVGVHCAAHRLNLASSQAADKVQYIKIFSANCLTTLTIVVSAWQG